MRAQQSAHRIKAGLYSYRGFTIQAYVCNFHTVWIAKDVANKSVCHSPRLRDTKKETR